MLILRISSVFWFINRDGNIVVDNLSFVIKPLFFFLNSNFCTASVKVITKVTVQTLPNLSLLIQLVPTQIHTVGFVNAAVLGW